MPKIAVRVSQRVFYEVEIEAATLTEALSIANSAINDPGPDIAGLDEYDITEVDSEEFAVDDYQPYRDL